MGSYTTTVDLGDTIPTVLEEARFTERFDNPMAALCWKIPKKLHQGSNVNVPYWGTVTAYNLIEGVDMVTPEKMVDTLVTITPGEVGCKIIITDKLVRDNQMDVVRAAGRILGEAMAYKQDYDLLSQLDDGSTSLGSTSTTLTLGAIAAARALLMGNAVSSGGPARPPYAFVHHPYTLLDLVDVFTPIIPTATYPSGASPANMSEKILDNYTIGRIFGMPIIEDGNLNISTSTSGKGGVFKTGSGGSIILSVAKEWGVEDERDASLRATELNIVGEYGCGEYLAAWIVELLMDATTPA